MPSILIFGRGFIGRRLARSLNDAYLSDVNITDEVAVRAAISQFKPLAVVNCAGKTGTPNVDWCETHQTETYKSNVIGPLVLASVCASAGVYLLHLGSGCIFYGPSPSPGGWREDDVANPSSFYSRTKCAADLVLSKMPNTAIVRLRMPIDDLPGPRNLITKLIGYKQVIDVENSVTIISDLVIVIRGLIQKNATGIFHATNPGTMRHRDLLSLYKSHVNSYHTYELINNDELLSRGLVTAARSNCILSSKRLDELGLGMRPIGTALEDTMRHYAEHYLAQWC